MNFKVLAHNWLSQQRAQGAEPSTLPTLRDLREAHGAEPAPPVDSVTLGGSAAAPATS